MNVTKYLLPPSDGASKGPHTSEYTMWSKSLALDGVKLLKEFLGCLLIKQLSQTLLGIWIAGNPRTISLSKHAKIPEI